MNPLYRKMSTVSWKLVCEAAAQVGLTQMRAQAVSRDRTLVLAVKDTTQERRVFMVFEVLWSERGTVSIHHPFHCGTLKLAHQYWLQRGGNEVAA